MKAFKLLIPTVLAVLSMASAASSPFTGKWVNPQVPQNTFEFLSKGRLLVVSGGLSMPIGEYEAISSKRVLLMYRMVGFGIDNPVATTMTLKNGRLCFDELEYRSNCYTKSKN